MSQNSKLVNGLALAVLMYGVSHVARGGAAKTWTAISDRPPPRDRSNHNVGFKEAVAWAALSGTAVGLARLLVRRGVADDDGRPSVS